MGRTIQVIPVNRVEGDLEIRLAIEDGRVTDAWCVGTMYRGFENILLGRSPLDSLVITPRVCGICSTAHLNAAARALDMIYQAPPPDTARRIRNVTLGVEMLQTDLRHSALLFMADFANPVYRDHSLYAEAVRRYEPLKGESIRRVVAETARVIEIIAILGGQWPHSSFMVPGGVVSAPGGGDVVQALHLLRDFRDAYFRRTLGCSPERWGEVKTADDLDAWLDESPAHRDGDLGFFLRFGREAGLDQIGAGTGNFLSLGGFSMPKDTAAAAFGEDGNLLPAGFFAGAERRGFNQDRVTEDVAHAWFRGDDGGVHPFRGTTQPYATGSEGPKYTWAKAPRYDGLPAETGPLAQLRAAGHPLVADLLARRGPSVLVRQLARMVRPAVLLPALETWLAEIGQRREPFFRAYDSAGEGEGFGLLEAPRGSLGHWVRLRNGRIDGYQIVTPTAWNAAPRDSGGVRGPMEEALLDTPVTDPENAVAAGHVIRSFDPCLVCTVHAVDLRDGGAVRMETGSRGMRSGILPPVDSTGPGPKVI
jgi:hydrogenase large subunit